VTYKLIERETKSCETWIMNQLLQSRGATKIAKCTKSQERGKRQHQLL